MRRLKKYIMIKNMRKLLSIVLVILAMPSCVIIENPVPSKTLLGYNISSEVKYYLEQDAELFFSVYYADIWKNTENEIERYNFEDIYFPDNKLRSCP